MSTSKQYRFTLIGKSPLIMHQDNVSFSERVTAWCKMPENKMLSRAGDDRTPAWTWLGYLYHDGKEVGIPSDCIMSALREAGAKVAVPGRSRETFKKYTQSGLTTDQIQFKLMFGPNYKKTLKLSDLKSLQNELDFSVHEKMAEKLGFELFVKRAAIMRAKHVRVRPLFRDWKAEGTITVFDEESSGLTQDVLETIMHQCGSYVGLCDWRPSSPCASGSYGRFDTIIKRL